MKVWNTKRGAGGGGRKGVLAATTYLRERANSRIVNGMQLLSDMRCPVWMSLSPFNDKINRPHGSSSTACGPRRRQMHGTLQAHAFDISIAIFKKKATTCWPARERVHPFLASRVLPSPCFRPPSAGERGSSSCE